MSIYNKYEACVLSNLLLDENKWSFKSNDNYTYMLEHVNTEQGYNYLYEIKNKFNELYNLNKKSLIDICYDNDIYGKTNKFDFNDFCSCSPSNLRYILHSFLALQFMKNNSLNNIDIIEIGGGYGGLCLFIYKIAPIFDIVINSYTIFDLEYPMILQKKYLKLHNININTYDINSNFNLNNNSFLISNYAFSEISLDLQQNYSNKLLNPYISYGFLAWNNIEVYNFIDNKDIKKEKEFPFTGPHNYYVYIKPTE